MNRFQLRLLFSSNSVIIELQWAFFTFVNFGSISAYKFLQKRNNLANVLVLYGFPSKFKTCLKGLSFLVFFGHMKMSSWLSSVKHLLWSFLYIFQSQTSYPKRRMQKLWRPYIWSFMEGGQRYNNVTFCFCLFISIFIFILFVGFFLTFKQRNLIHTDIYLSVM